MTEYTGPAPGTPPLPVVEAPAKVAQRRRAPARPKVVPVAQTEAQMKRPSLAFFTEVSQRIKSNAETEMSEIEAEWTRLHTRYLELRTLAQSVDAANAVMVGDPTPIDPRISQPGGAVDAEALQRIILGLRGRDTEEPLA